VGLASDRLQDPADLSHDEAQREGHRHGLHQSVNTVGRTSSLAEPGVVIENVRQIGNGSPPRDHLGKSEERPVRE